LANRKINRAIYILLVLCVSAPLYGQYNKSNWYGGIFADYIIPTHITDFAALPGVPNCCPQFIGGSGTGYYVGSIWQYRFYGYNNIVVKAGYTSITAELSANEGEWVIIDEELTPATIQHNLNTRFNSVSIEPMYKYNTVIGLSFNLGLNLSWLFSATYEQNEILIKPANEGTFENGKRIRNEQSGDLEEYNKFIYFAELAAEYEISLDEYDVYILVPRFGFSYGINSVLKEDKWRITYFSFGLSLKYNPFIELSNPLNPN